MQIQVNPRQAFESNDQDSEIGIVQLLQFTSPILSIICFWGFKVFFMKDLAMGPHGIDNDAINLLFASIFLGIGIILLGISVSIFDSFRSR